MTRKTKFPALIAQPTPEAFWLANLRPYITEMREQQRAMAPEIENLRRDAIMKIAKKHGLRVPAATEIHGEKWHPRNPIFNLGPVTVHVECKDERLDETTRKQIKAFDLSGFAITRLCNLDGTKGARQFGSWLRLKYGKKASVEHKTMADGFVEFITKFNQCEC